MDTQYSESLNKNKRVRIFSLEFLLILVAILMVTGACGVLFYGTGGDEDSHVGSPLIAQRGQGDIVNPIRQIILMPIYFYALLYLVIRWRKSLPVIKAAWPLAVIGVLTVLSVVWSIDPTVTLRRSINALGGTMLAFYFVTRYSSPQFLRILGYCMIAVCLVTLLAVILDPAQGIHHDKHYPAFRGYFNHKNTMGSTMVASTLIALLLMHAETSRRMGIFLFVISIILAIGSLSRGAWLLLTSMIGIFYLTKLMRRTRVGSYIGGNYIGCYCADDVHGRYVRTRIGNRNDGARCHVIGQNSHLACRHQGGDES
ncbi:MAG: hypothetical protein WDO70_04665 [Alphaproteobacteria bacterium]